MTCRDLKMTTLAEQYDRQRAWRDYYSVYELLGPLTGCRVVDFGCGSGTVSADLAARAADVTGIDTDGELIAHASQQVPFARFVNASIEEPAEWGSGRFDLIWCSFAISYLSDPVSAISKWRAVLKPGVLVIVIEMADLFAHEPLSKQDRQRLSAYEGEVSQEAGPAHVLQANGA
ncbi:hypothetical protein DDZ14_14345 [Maritimibacter sp. 55A14]|nr:hypothetical protein DDZ14_14345 [Maritimibacter sp. 55A14]